MKLDWKFFLGTVVAVAGIAATIYVWRADLSSKAVTVRTVSRTALQPQQASGVQGLRVLIDNNQLMSPWLVVVEVKNTGIRPISASEFESPLEITAGTDSTIIRAQLTSTAPRDIQPRIAVEQGTLKISPLLLNPDDTITIAAIADRGAPTISARSRIAGVSSITVQDDTKKGPSIALGVVGAAFVFFATMASGICQLLWESADRVRLKRRGALLLYAITSITSIGGLYVLLEMFSHVSWLLFIPLALVLAIASVALAMSLKFIVRVPAPVAQSGNGVSN
jgi:hypothetical protein